MKLLIAGSTGLIGGHALHHALNTTAISGVTSVGRRLLSFDHPKLNQIATDFSRLDGIAARMPPVDAAICALGTTIRQAGSRPAFSAVDHDAVLAFAAQAREKGARRFAVVSSVGADSRSGNFYLATKGRMEDGLRRVGFECLAILRPSFLVGERTEKRQGEGFATALAQLASPLLVGNWRRYRPIAADTVARALVQAVTVDAAPDGIIEYDGIIALAGR